MSLFDRDNPAHVEIGDRIRRSWTRAHEEALQRRFVADGLQTEEEFAAKMARRDARERAG